MTQTLTVVGCGYTGRRILLRRPDAIGLNRSIPSDTTGKRIRRVDLDAEIDALETTDAVIYTVAPDADGLRLQRLLGALVAPPRRIVYLSTTGVYGDLQGRRVAESAAVNPATERATRRVADEARLAGYASEIVVLRVPGIYGPGRLGLERREAGEAVIREADAGPGNRIHVEDLADLCLWATDAAIPAGIYNVGDADHRSSTAFAQEVARQAGLPVPREISMAEAQQQFSPMRLSFLQESRRVDTSRIQALDAPLRYHRFEDGIRASLSVQ